MSHFSGVAAGYATYRPRYPAQLFEALAALAPDRLLAWDCGAGNGQASRALAEHYAHVVATDISEQQIANAEPHDRVEYRVAPAERSGLAAGSVALVTVAQALHWFKVDAFHAEAKRVLKPGGVIAEWTYTLLDVPDAPAVADVVNDMDARMKFWWPPERAHVDARYDTLSFPFERVALPMASEPAMKADWTAEQMCGYVATWSAVSRYRAANADDPMVGFKERLSTAWGSPERHVIRWPLVIRVGRA